MDEKIKKVIEYIIAFMIRDEEAAKKIAYNKNPDGSALISIVQSDFFDNGIYMTEKSIPAFPLDVWRTLPILYGNSGERTVNGNLVIQADLVASSFFLMTRYEEYINHDNYDSHHRFMGVGSVPAKGGFLEHPVIDEYGLKLRKIFEERGVKLKPIEVGTVYLTHDVDVPWKTWTFVSALRNCLGHSRRLHRIELWPLKNFFGLYENGNNPFDTFDWIFEKDKTLKNSLKDNCKIIFFLIAINHRDSNTESYIMDKKLQSLLERLRKHSDCLGLHLSYNTGFRSDAEGMKAEKERLEEILEEQVSVNRNHYLLSAKPGDFRILNSIGIKEDFTMGYADRIGFRLGTARAVQWIDPEAMELTDLKLHPLVIMECSMTEKQYMGFDREECIASVHRLYQACQSVKGDFTILLHNSILIPGKCEWVKDVYEDAMNYIKLDFAQWEEGQRGKILQL